MSQLTKREEQVMEVIIKLKSAYIRDIREAMPVPQPHYNTVATLVKFLEEKGAVIKEKVGNTYRYSPAGDFMQAYRDKSISNIKERFFDNSFPKMMAHFAKKENLSESEIEELIKIIQSKKS